MSLSHFILDHTKNQFLHKAILRKKFSNHGFVLGELLSFYNRYYLYELDGIFVPHTALTWHYNPEEQLRISRRTSLLHYTPKAGDVIVDVGAGIGEEVLYYSRSVGENGKVICIEPNPEAYTVLMQVIKKNGLQNVTSFQSGIHNYKGITWLANDSEYLAGTTDGREKNGKGFEVSVDLLQNILGSLNLDKISFLKVNIEGAERFLENSLGSYSIKNIENIAIAAHDFRYYNEQEHNPFFLTHNLIIEFLKDQNLEVVSGEDLTSFVDNWVHATQKSGH